MSVPAQALWLIALGFAINAVYLALSHSFGYGAKDFLPGPQDRFADLVKVALSFRHETDALRTTIEFANWPMLYRDYLLRNPYFGLEGLEAGRLTHMHHPPLSQLSFNLAAKLIAASASPTLALWVWFATFATCVAWLARTCTPNDDRKKWYAVKIAALCVVSYPALCVVIRGNYHAGFAAILSAIFLYRCLADRELSWPEYLALGLAINFRPVAIIFVVAIPYSLGLRQSFRPMTRTLALAGSVFFASLVAENSLYPDYGIQSFLNGLHNYGNLYVVGPMGDGGNASLWSLVKNGARMADSYMFHEEMWRIFVALAFGVCILAWRTIRESEHPPSVAAFVLVSLYTLLPPICAEYHLLIFAAPLIIAAKPSLESGHRQTVAVLASILMLVPKTYVFINEISIQTIINPAILIVALLLLQTEVITTSSARSKDTS